MAIKDGADIWDVIIVGAGPTGLTLANLLGAQGVRTLLLEQMPDIIDYPRGVGMDDEALRSFQAAGLGAEIEKHTTPFHWVRFIWPSGKVMAEVQTRDTPYGWSRRNAFNQPLVDRELLLGLARYDNVTVRFNARSDGVSQTGDCAEVSVVNEEDGSRRTLKARYVVGTDGGRSPLREALGIAFEGSTSPTRWVVVDIRNDPIGRPNVEFFLNPENPFVSIALPGGIRRLEFSVTDNEIHNDVDVTDEALKRKYKGLFDTQEFDRIDHIRRRVYTHNARVASTFRKGRVFLAGDAAHLMPVWQGQGFNTGIRDATNLAWKLVLVLKGVSQDALLDTYDVERRPHAKSMVDTSVLMGKIFAPRNALARLGRDIVFNIVNRVPTWKDYITRMRWKPMPKFHEGAITKGRGALTGQLFPQPGVLDSQGTYHRMDDLIGCNPAIVSWGVDAAHYLTDAQIEAWRQLGGQFLSLYPQCQRDVVLSAPNASTPVFDPDGKVKTWFDEQDQTVHFIRPDRIVAASCRPINTPETFEAMLQVLAWTGQNARKLRPSSSEPAPIPETAEGAMP